MFTNIEFLRIFTIYISLTSKIQDYLMIRDDNNAFIRFNYTNLKNDFFVVCHDFKLTHLR